MTLYLGINIISNLLFTTNEDLVRRDLKSQTAHARMYQNIEDGGDRFEKSLKVC